MQKKKSEREKGDRRVRVLSWRCTPLTLGSIPASRKSTSDHPQPRFIPRPLHCSHVAVGCCCQGQRLGEGEKGKWWKHERETEFISLFNTKNTRKATVYPYCKLPIFFLCKCNKIKRFGLVLRLRTPTCSNNTTACIWNSFPIIRRTRADTLQSSTQLPNVFCAM